MSGMANTSVKRMARHLFRMTRDLAEKDRIEVNEKIKHHFRNNLMGSREERYFPHAPCSYDHCSSGLLAPTNKGHGLVVCFIVLLGAEGTSS